MTQSQILQKTREFVRKTLEKEATGHDWYHIERVVRSTKLIGKREKADLFVAELGALLHDIADWKFHADPDAGVKISRKFLTTVGLDKQTTEQVCYIVQNISFKGGTNKHKMQTVEGKVVQDADRLDAIGAIGIARTFAYGGSLGRKIYDPKIKPQNVTKHNLQNYKKDTEKFTSLNHFYEKVLWLPELMNTKTGHKLALLRETFVKQYLKQFYKEWEGEI